MLVGEVDLVGGALDGGVGAEGARVAALPRVLARVAAQRVVVGRAVRAGRARERLLSCVWRRTCTSSEARASTLIRRGYNGES